MWQRRKKKTKIVQEWYKTYGEMIILYVSFFPFLGKLFREKSTPADFISGPYLMCSLLHSGASQVALVVRTCQCRRRKRCRFDPRVWKIAWRRTWQPTLVSLPAEPHEQKSLVGYSPQTCKESNRHNWNDSACDHSILASTHRTPLICSC